MRVNGYWHGRAPDPGPATVCDTAITASGDVLRRAPDACGVGARPTDERRVLGGSFEGPHDPIGDLVGLALVEIVGGADREAALYRRRPRRRWDP